MNPSASVALPLSPGAAWRLARRWLVATAHHVGEAPATFGYLVALVVTTVALAWVGHRAGTEVILKASTNVQHLATTPLRVLLASAFWLASGFKELANWGVLFPMVLAPVERRLGTVRMIVAFAAGHVGATLASQGLTAFAIAHGLMARSLADAPDVGASYGFAAVAAVLFSLVPRRWQASYAVALVVWLAVVSHLRHPDFTTFGHAVAALIGLGLGWALRGTRRGHDEPPCTATSPVSSKPLAPPA